MAGSADQLATVRSSNCSSPQELSRADLYGLAWAEPLSKLAPELGFSDVGLAKLCRQASIPLPARGYWQKVRAGKRISKPPLPPRPPGVADRIVVGRDRDRWAGGWSAEELLEPIPPPPSFPEPLDEVRTRAAEMVGKVFVPRLSARCHGVVAAVLREDERRREKQQSSSFLLSWDKPLYDTPLQRRRLRIVNALFLAMARCGGKPSPVRRNDEDFSVQIGEPHVAFTLEAVDPRHRARKGGSNQHGPDPKELHLEIKTHPDVALRQNHWRDQEANRLEDQLTEIAVEFLVCAEAHYRHQVHAKREWRIERKARLEEEARRRKAEAERQERERQAALERQRVERLLGEATALQQAKAIRRYVEEVRAEAASSDLSITNADLEAWEKWALAQADAIDPILSRAFLRAAAADESSDTGS